MPALSRRQLLALAPALLWVPRPGLAVEPNRRKFLFVFAEGGWDQTILFAPLFGASNVDMEADAVAAEAHGIPFVDHPERPSVSDFMRRFGDRSCFINGFEARSVAHEACLHLVMTGSALPTADDWPSLIAHHTGGDLMLPFIHLSGPSYAHSLGSEVVRVGAAGQFAELIDGRALARADRVLRAPSATASELQDAFVTARVARLVGAAGAGRESALLDRSAEIQAQMARVSGLPDILSFGDVGTLEGGMGLLADAFAANVARCGMVRHGGANNLGWDTHALNAQQGWSFEDLFAALVATMDKLDATPGVEGGTLADEVTVVVLSEMGRYPLLNSRGGKDHWTFTSAIVIGAGVRGGQAVGGYDEICAGKTVDLASGEATPSGQLLTPNHIGATLLKLAGVDPAGIVPNAEPIDAVLA